MRVIQLFTPIALALTVRAVAVPAALDARQANAPGCTVALFGQCGGQSACGSVRLLLLLDAGLRVHCLPQPGQAARRAWPTRPAMLRTHVRIVCCVGGESVMAADAAVRRLLELLAGVTSASAAAWAGEKRVVDHAGALRTRIVRWRAVLGVLGPVACNRRAGSHEGKWCLTHFVSIGVRHRLGRLPGFR
jgi:hypothetical protein